MRFYTNIEHVKELLNKLEPISYNKVISMLDERWGRLQAFEIYTDCLLGYMLHDEVRLLEETVNTGITETEVALLESEIPYI